MGGTTATPRPGPPSQPPPSPQSSTGFAPAIPTNEPCPIEDRDDGCAQAIAVDRPVETYRGRFAPEAVIPFRELDRVEGYSRTFGQRSGSNTGTTKRRRFDRLTRPATIR